MLSFYSTKAAFAKYVGMTREWWYMYCSRNNTVKGRWQVKIIEYIGALNYYTFLLQWRGKRGYDVSEIQSRIDELQKVANRKATQGVIAE